MKIKKCNKCKRYTMKDKCPTCGGETINPLPPKFSPIDKFGKWRRKLIKGNL